ncbi:AMP-binding protein [Kineobactrum salinum]|uniref:AMP-binding protein n=1 Tax=Kineobactrum salinum TaxID=2708301 RepID=UPI0018D88A64|nr:AMP-binding protein [Kineobactrum salinum]
MEELLKEKPYIRIFRELKESDPKAKAISCEDDTVTRDELDRGSNRLARAFEAEGVEQGDFVTIALPNSIAFYENVLACWKVGAVPQPVSHRLPLPERQAIVELADSRLVVGVGMDDHPGRKYLPAGYKPAATLSDAPMEERVSPVSKAMTSGGSTGRPKLILSGTPAVGVAGMGLVFHMTPSDRQLVSGPLYHNASFILSLAGLLLGQHIVVMPKFDAEKALENIRKHQITWVNFVPTMMSRMLKLIEAQPDRHDLSSLRVFWHMAAPCAEWLKQAWIDLVGAEKVWELYGGTEAVAQTCINGTEWLEHRGSVGKPILGGQMRILNDAGEEAAPGEIGEIYMRGPEGAPPSYHYVGAEKKEKEGWETIGDLGWMDEDGYLYISDRRTDMIVAGGANVYPAEVEAAIESHRLVRSCAVVGLPDSDLGQRVHAVVHPAPASRRKHCFSFWSRGWPAIKCPVPLNSWERICGMMRVKYDAVPSGRRQSSDSSWSRETRSHTLRPPA